MTKKKTIPQQSDYLRHRRTEINKAIEFAIQEHLDILNSDIVLPTKKGGSVNDVRLLSTVKSREKFYNNLISMMDNPDLSEYVKNKATPMVLSGLKKTMEELTSKILYRPIRSSLEDAVLSFQKSLVKDDDEYFGPEILMESSDDIAASVSDAVKSASDLVFIIYNRIAQMENPEEAKKQKVENQIIPSIAERYAKNR